MDTVSAVDLADIVSIRDGRVTSYWANGKYDTCDYCARLWPVDVVVYLSLPDLYLCPLCHTEES